jgi:hypothetical protein
MTKIGQEKHLELPNGVLKDEYVIVAVNPDMCESTTSKIYRRLTALKAFEGRTIGEALGTLRMSPITPFGLFDMRCHVARKRITVRGIEVYQADDQSRPRIVDTNAGLIYDWSGAVIGDVPRGIAIQA